LGTEGIGLDYQPKLAQGKAEIRQRINERQMAADVTLAHLKKIYIKAEGREIGDGAQTGVGSAVTRDVPPGRVAYGVPARVKLRTGIEEPEGKQRDRG